MRKWVVTIIILLAIVLLFYRMAPGKMSIHQNLMVAVNPKAFAREMLNEKNWNEWWPGKQMRSSPGFEYKDNSYRVIEKKLTSFVIEVSNGKESITTELIYIPVRNDSVQLNWVAEQKSGLSPFKRIRSFQWSKNLESDLHILLEKMNSFYSNEDNIYGLHVEKSLVADSNYVFTSLASKTYPSMQTVYGLVDKLKNFIAINKAQSLGYPMLNVHKNGDSSYLVKVALPVDKQLKDAGDIQYRWMLKGGNILVTEIKGGPSKIEKAFTEMRNYVEDHQRIAPAIPFQSLVTDRREEPDTNKWITKLYWPVM
jgi:effector-binding domain-containing protein